MSFFLFFFLVFLSDSCCFWLSCFAFFFRNRGFLFLILLFIGEVHFEMHHDEDDTSMLFELIPIECPRFCLSEDFYNPSSRSYSFVEMDSCRRYVL